MISGISTYQKFRCDHIDHMPDTHKIHQMALVSIQFFSVRSILGDHIIDMIFLSFLFLMVHTMFKEIISIILGHHTEFLIYQLDMSAVPIWLQQIISSKSSQLFYPKSQMIIFPFLTKLKCQLFGRSIIGVKEKSISSLIAASVKKRGKQAVCPCHKNSRFKPFSCLRIYKHYYNIPIETFQIHIFQIQTGIHILQIFFYFNSFDFKIVTTSFFLQLTSEPKNHLFRFITIFVRICNQM